jgi:ankyrin repeat protein
MELAIERGDVIVVRTLVEFGGADVNGQCATRRQPPFVRLATILGQVEVCAYLVAAGADLTGLGDCGRTILHAAAKRGNIEICTLLLDAGADVSRVDVFRDTVLHFAARGGFMVLCALLIARGASVDAWNRDGQTAASYAREAGHESVAAYLEGISKAGGAR